ncbi:MAG: family 16 glycoside hydrolase [Planctomycetota bacterium]
MALSIACLLALAPQVTSDAPSTLELFDGTSLSGWSGDPRFWSVEDGAIVGRTTPENPCEATTYLVYEGREFDDFDLSVEYRIDGGNSGIQFRSVVTGDWLVEGYQADLDDAREWTGGFYEQGGRGVLCRRVVDLLASGTGTAYELLGDPAEMAKVGGPREWHTYRVRAVGSVVELFIDGTLTARLDDRDPVARRSGIIALQLHQGPPMEVRYRNLIISPIEAEPRADLRWIWSPEEVEDDERVRFERMIRPGPGLKTARVFATADNGVELSIDDHVFAAGEKWWAPFEIELAPKLVEVLGDGKPHRLAASCWNEGGPAGFVARFTFDFEDGRTETVTTDRWWRVEGDVGAAVDLGPYGMEPWGEPEERSSGSPDLSLPASQLELPPGFEAEALMRVPREHGSWVALTVDERGRIIASAEAARGLFRVTLGETGVESVEPLGIEIGGAQGLLALGRDLYIVRNEFPDEANGLYRARDVDGDDAYDELQFLKKLNGAGEHGPHAVRLTPDGKRLQVIAGNSVEIPDEVARWRVPPSWFDDQVLPSLPDTFKHGNAMHLHGGWTATCDLDGKDWEVLVTGMRNAYDFAYDADGNAFAYDADMEWDIGAPWYRAPRVVHLAPGLEYGWRRGSGKIDSSAPETFPPVCETGPASPVGVLHGKDGGFHAPYRDQLFIGDWTRGVVYGVALTPGNGTFTGEARPFIQGRPFPITDMEWLPDGSMIVVTGGRGIRSGMYRIRSTIERVAMDGGDAVEATDAPSMEDRMRRTRLELDPDIDAWGARALADRDPQGLLALARIGGGVWQERTLEAVLDPDGPLDRVGLRTIELSLARTGDPSSELRERIGARLAAMFPVDDERANVAIVEVLVRVGSEAAPALAVPRMESATTQESALDYAMALRLARAGWTDDLARRYLDFLHDEATRFRGGKSLAGYVDRIRAAAMENAAPFVEGGYTPPAPTDVVGTGHEIEAALFVNEWTLGEVLPSLRFLPQAEDRAKGERAFRRAGCYACHRVGEEGGGTGPDLTNAGGRFSPRDLLIAIVEPSRDISDQYRDTEVWANDGEVFVGRLVERDDEWITLELPPSEPGGIDGEVVDVALEDVKVERPSPMSRMPVGTVDCLDSIEILEMVAWLLEAR